MQESRDPAKTALVRGYPIARTAIWVLFSLVLIAACGADSTLESVPVGETAAPETGAPEAEAVEAETVGTRDGGTRDRGTRDRGTRG